MKSGRKVVHTSWCDGMEMVEEYDLQADVLLGRCVPLFVVIIVARLRYIVQFVNSARLNRLGRLGRGIMRSVRPSAETTTSLWLKARPIQFLFGRTRLRTFNGASGTCRTLRECSCAL